MLSGKLLYRHLKKLGWTYRSAPRALGCSNTHLAFILTDRRESRRLAARIMDLPSRDEWDRQRAAAADANPKPLPA